MVHYQYSGNEHDVIAGIGLVNLLWHNLTTVESIPIDYQACCSIAKLIMTYKKTSR
ncbi:hypothetical protein [Candidatus Arsenophonus triatominarum]|uniref:hypothetical protein n=1 Tax=Candidatus Arsenophonus triatominarum TaxID=57911 RepID=UPI000B267B31|nr:hypothetical protein [Candidatus Arsenophonus triatominarum]